MSLAENPNLINPTLNNTGPFRWWLHEAFEDNRPFDRFATELILMEGSTHYGGPAGFGIASQNDSPMAAKAHVLAQAFLGMEMKCARCHDAPYHPFTQKDLFSFAAMLNRETIKLPKTSTIPGDPAALQSLLVKVTLKPGEAIPPDWPFAEELSGQYAVDMLRLLSAPSAGTDFSSRPLGPNTAWPRDRTPGIFWQPVPPRADRRPTRVTRMDLTTSSPTTSRPSLPGCSAICKATTTRTTTSPEPARRAPG